MTKIDKVYFLGVSQANSGQYLDLIVLAGETRVLALISPTTPVLSISSSSFLISSASSSCYFLI